VTTPVDPLVAFVRALATSRTLPWVVQHAPDGDVDAALRRAWAACADDHAMWVLAAATPGVDIEQTLCASETCSQPTCGGCAAQIRRVVPVPPSFAALHADPAVLREAHAFCLRTRS